MKTKPATINDPGYWETNYRNGRLPWDLGGATPVFGRLAEDNNIPPGRMLVLGAGSGHDARLFARHGFQVTAVDFADGAVRTMQTLQDPEAPIIILQADLFEMPSHLKGLFDYVLEYVFFCAIDPSRRERYADVVAQLIQPGGVYIALAFPLGDLAGGPPFTVSADELVDLFTARGFILQHREFPPESITPRRGNEELLILKKKDQV